MSFVTIEKLPQQKSNDIPFMKLVDENCFAKVRQLILYCVQTSCSWPVKNEVVIICDIKAMSERIWDCVIATNPFVSIWLSSKC